MEKIYVYEDIIFNANNDTQINVSVEFLSDGNQAATTIHAPKKSTKTFENSATRYIGLAKDLRSSALIISTKARNMIKEEDTIIINYKINDTIIKKHANAKSDADEILIILYIFILPL